MDGMKGFTLIELMISVMLLVVLLSVGVPSFGSIIEQNRLVTRTNLVVSALHLARSEAVKRGKTITICKSTNSINCTTDNTVGFENGWIIYEEQPASLHPIGTRDTANEPILKVQEALDNSFTLRGNNRFTNYISYLSSGAIANSDPDTNPDHFVLCINNAINKARAIFINTTGRTHIGNDNNNNGSPENESGNDLTTCTPG